MKRLIGALMMISVLSLNSCFSQKSLIKIANQYFDAGKYAEAVAIFESQNKKIAKDTRLLIRRGIAHYHSNNPDACIRDMEAARLLKTRDKEIYRYAGLAYFIKGNYQTASEFLKTYLSHIKQGHKHFDHTVQQVKRCGKAMKMKHEPAIAFIQNLGSEINSPQDDFAPVQSPTRQNRIYFSSAREGTEGGLRDENGSENPIKGKFTSDIFYAESTSGLWSQAFLLDRLTHTPKHEVIQGFSPDGTIMYYLQTLDFVTGQILTDTFGSELNIFNILSSAKIPANASYGDKDLQVFSDSLLIFSAVRPEGYGGFDLYYVRKRGFTWDAPVNFGPVINTAFNEVSPFLTKNGKVLYFSSDKISGAGGFDIYKSVYDLPYSEWGLPVNLALPVNSTKDDLDWTISADGTTGYFSSDRIGGLGGMDIYSAYLNEQEINQLEYTEEPDFLNVQSELLAEGPTEVKNNIKITERTDIPVREYVATPLYYKPNEEILTPQNIILMKRISELMQIFPELKLVLTAHTSEGTRPEIDVFFSAKTAEKLSDYLKTSGIRPDRIIIQSCGSTFPTAKYQINGIPSNLAGRYNHRIDIHFLNIPSNRLRVKNDFPVISEDFKDPSWDVFYEDSKGVTFRIDLTTTTQVYTGVAFETEAPVIMYKYAHQNAYLYTAGNFTEYLNALALRNMLIRKGCENCRISAFLNGDRLSQDDWEKYSEEYPELKNLSKE